MSAGTENNTTMIKGAQYPLSKIFSSEFDYSIPSYQRPYAWTENHASTLFDDLCGFYREEQKDAYFLGSIVLIKEEGKRPAEVIDGQQRLTTLTILLAAIAHLLRDDHVWRANVESYVQDPGNPVENIQPEPRLALRERDRKFFAETVQSFNFDKLKATDPATLPNEAQKHIRENGLLLLELLEREFKDIKELQNFCQFLVNRCFMVVVSTPSRGSAFRVFSVLNGRGLDLLTSDLIKAEVIGAIDAARQDEYTQKWENMEEGATRDGLNALLGHIRTVYLRERAKEDLYKEFTGKVMGMIGKEAGERRLPEYLIDDVLEPYAAAFFAAKNLQYTASGGKLAHAVNDLLGWLNRIDNSDWLPPALVFLKQNHKPEDTLWFFHKLERLAACLHLCGRNVNHRVQRYRPVIEALQNDRAGDGLIGAVELTGDEKQELQDVLNGDIYHMQARRRNYLLLRLDAFVSENLAVYDPDRMTVEHVLPQTVNAGSEWARLWPDAEQRKQWTHRLANLVILTRIRNSKAQNYDFATKKSKYFGGSRDVSSFVLTSQVLQKASWTPEVVQERQEELLGALANRWELK